LWPKRCAHTSEESAARLGCVPRTAERRLGVIRACWQEDRN
jgi:hypothetical protein